TLQPSNPLESNVLMACRTTLPHDIDYWAARDVVLALGEGFHLLIYAMGKNRPYNCVLIIPQAWYQEHATQLSLFMGKKLGAPLADLFTQQLKWEFFPLYQTKPISSPQQLHCDLVCLVGDAGHITLPFQGQGAAMAIEDAYILAQCLQKEPFTPRVALANYACMRANRVARVQRKALINGKLFHAKGLIKKGLVLGLQVASQRLLNLPWLYDFALD
ncbi:MAG: FAD-dependent monooxygenase, partial [Gammaproteobacteria bacterium]|nr:FAD-dependent monooxygenase [Gammaproteobacteria bacterium]